VLDAGISSIAVVLKHAAIYPEHERLVGQLATQMGFKQVSGWGGGKKPSTDE
jgi:5-oxoprolinase (ATP-hydrolysing)